MSASRDIGSKPRDINVVARSDIPASRRATLAVDRSSAASFFFEELDVDDDAEGRRLAMSTMNQETTSQYSAFTSTRTDIDAWSTRAEV